jgi:hypothetical protein
MYPQVRIALLLPALMVLGPVAVGQSTFMKMYNRGNSGFAVREVPGGYAVAGGTDFYFNWHWFQLSQPATTDIHLFKTDQNGTLIWERVIGSPLSRTIARWMEPTSDGGYIITGSSSTERMWPPDSNDVVLVKTDGLGNPAWSRVFDTGKDELGFCVQQTSDGGYIVSGFHDAAPVSAVGSTHILLIKTDGLGAVQWEKKIPFAIRDFITGEPFTYVAKQTADGGYVIVGTGVGLLTLGVYVVRTNATGDVQWAKVYDHDATALRYSTGLDIIEHTNGDLIIAGSMDKSQPMETNYPYTLKISSTGTLLTARFYETVPLLFFQSGFSSVRPTSSGGFFFCGMGGYGGFGDQAQLLKTDAALNAIWSRVYTWDGMATMGSRDGRPTSDGGYIFTGKRQLAGTALMKVDALGMIPCKVPNSLAPLTPSLSTLTLTPIAQPLSIGAPIVFGTTSPLVDSTTVCPVSTITLPIELGSFTATVQDDGHVRTEWTTLSERDNDYFLVERSADGASFDAVGRVLGAGNSTSELHYSWVDVAPIQAPISYYRLTQVDLNGTTTRSEVVTAAFPPKELRLLSVSGSDGTGIITINILSDREGPLELIIHDLAGKAVSRGIHAVTRGANTLSINAPARTSGLYTITLTNAGSSVTGRIVF